MSCGLGLLRMDGAKELSYVGKSPTNPFPFCAGVLTLNMLLFFSFLFQ